MHEEELGELGLSANEARIYLALLPKGAGTPLEISSKTGLHRAYVYDALERMLEKGIVAEVSIGGRKHFQPAAPARLLEIQRTRLERLEKAMPYLQKLAGESAEETKVELLKGRGVAKTLFRDAMATMKPGDEFLGVLDDEEVMREDPIILRQYINHIVRNKIRERVITKVGGKTLPEAKTTQYRMLPEKYLGSVNTWIYGSKVAFMVLGAPNFGIIVHNSRVAQNYRNQFELLWEKAKPVRRSRV